ncbi:MAG: GAF domain-containing protein [Myxococcaceae bacterium]|nr:GAF domain-containing protein [Myxococcaceae bacterium]
MSDEVARLHELTVALRAPQSLEEVLQTLVDQTSHLLNVVRVAAYLFNADHTRLTATARAGLPIHTAPIEFRIGEGLLGWIAERQVGLRTGDAEADPRFLARPGQTVKIGSFVGVPILGSTTVLGVLSATNPDPHAFGPRDQQLLEIAAALAAPAIEATTRARSG